MRNQAKWLWLLALVLLAGCGGSGSSPALGEEPEISGKVQDWSGSSGTVLAVNLGGQTLGEGTIQSDGSFRVQMYSLANDYPSALTEISLSDSSDACVIEVSPSGVQWGMAQFLEGPGGELIGIVDDPLGPRKLGSLIYVDGDVTITSQGVCSIEWDLDLKRGWNWVVQTIADDGSSVVESKYPSGMEWHVLY